MSAVGGSPPLSSTLAHLSDVHFGAEDPALVAGLQTALTTLGPDLIVVSGDLTQRARRKQFRAARAWLDALPAPWLVIPGNHDVPLYDLFRRVFSPLGRYHGMITSVRAPFATAPGVRVLGLDSTRRKTTGRLRPERLESLARLDGGWPGDLRVLTVHHPLTETQTDGFEAALRAALAVHVDVVLTGHTHLTRRKVVERDPGLGVLLVNAGTATSVRRRTQEPTNNFNVLRWDGEARLDVEVWRAAGAVYAPVASHKYARTPDGWRAVPSP